jgi:Prokaryotic N-terminal methylation motif
MRRRAGYALSELLVAVAIAGLIIGVLTFLNVDYVGLARRVVDTQGPYALGGRAEAQGDRDRCADVGATWAATNDAVVAQEKHTATPVLTLVPDGAATQLVTSGGLAGKSSQPLRVTVENGASSGAVAAIEVGDATVGVVARRCDLTEICDYDATNALCRAPTDTNNATNATDGTDAANASDGGSALAGHG